MRVDLFHRESCWSWWSSWYKKANWTSDEQATRHALCFRSCFQVPTLNFFPDSLPWWCRRTSPINSQVSFGHINFITWIETLTKTLLQIWIYSFWGKSLAKYWVSDFSVRKTWSRNCGKKYGVTYLNLWFSMYNFHSISSFASITQTDLTELRKLDHHMRVFSSIVHTFPPIFLTSPQVSQGDTI